MNAAEIQDPTTAEEESNDTNSRPEDLKRSNTKIEIDRLKRSWRSLIAIVTWVFAIQAVAIAFFTRGFLLSRPVLDERSQCLSPPIQRNKLLPSFSPSADECWMEKSFEKAVIVVIDALRFDFVVPGPGNDTMYYHDSLPFLYEHAQNHPENSLLVKFMADPPTTTLQRLKGLTTGSLPTFIDAGSNFAGSAINEDNWISQLKSQGRRFTFMGDDTWTALFSASFEPNQTFAYDSLNVWDLHTVDNGVIEHIFPALENGDQWDMAIGHLLGVDHAGHRYGPNHVAMQEKLNQMNTFIQNLVSKIDDNTLLVVMGDHGMDSKGDHGGDAELELESTLWMYSKKPFFGRHPAHEYDILDGGKNFRSVDQIDLVPTISLLLGCAIPYNNLGIPIEEAFTGPSSHGIQKLAIANYLTTSQINRYRQQLASLLDDQGDKLWSAIESAAAARDWSALNKYAQEFQQHNLKICQDLWIKFDVISILIGLFFMGASICLMIGLYRYLSPERAASILFRVTVPGIITAAISTTVSLVGWVSVESPYAFGFGLANGALGGFIFSALQRGTNLAGPGNWWSLFAIYLGLLHALLFTSNSFTVWEDRALHYLLATFGVAMFLNSFRLPDTKSKLTGAWHAITFLTLSKLSTYSRLCREEQGESCVTTFYQEGSSVSPPQALYGFAFVVLALPQIIKSFYKSSASYRGSAPLWIGKGLQVCMLLTLVYWLVDGADTYGWSFVYLSTSTLRTIKLIIARSILGATLVAANYGWYLGTLCVSINVTKNGAAIMGYSNMYGSTYFLFIVNIFAAALVVTKPVGGIALSIMVYQMLTLLELIDLYNLKYSILGPVVLGLLGSSYFFSTGHHATLPAIQWEIGFVPAATITFPITHLAIFLNTFAPSILATLTVPLVVLWKIPPSVKPKAVVTRITRSLLGIAFYQAIVTFSTMIWAAYFRRHLMIWKIFSPRYMLGGIALLVVDIFVVVGLAVGGQSVTYITGIFS